MDSERWKQVDDVLQSVLDRPPEERETLLRRIGLASAKYWLTAVNSAVSTSLSRSMTVRSPCMAYSAV